MIDIPKVYEMPVYEQKQATAFSLGKTHMHKQIH